MTAAKPKLNWKLILALSLFGVAMGFGTVFAISPRVEPFFWLVIFIICAFLIARRVPLRAFFHGFLLGIVNSVWVTAAHLIFFNRYLMGHTEQAQMMRALHASGVVPHVVMSLVGLGMGLIPAVVMGVLAYVLAKAFASSGVPTSGRPQKVRVRAR
jgi:hypothetical protein